MPATGRSSSATISPAQSTPSARAWLEGGLEVPLASTIAVRDVAAGLRRIQKTGGRVAVRVAGSF